MASKTDPKVFGIGLQKTGTSSLHTALETMGVRCRHFPIELLTSHWQGKGAPKEPTLSHDAMDLAAAREWDALCDLPVCLPEIIEKLDKAFPGARFIYTDRSVEAWVRSVEKHYERDAATAVKRYREKEYPGYDASRDMFRNCDPLGLFEFTYGIPVDSPDRSAALTAYFQRHRAFVDAYFADRPGDILYLDVAAEGAMRDLGEFIGKPAPYANFPHRNPAAKNTFFRPLFERAVLGPYRRIFPESLRFHIRRRKDLAVEKYFRHRNRAKS